MRILVTGASGFVGRQTISSLVATGAEVVAVTRQRIGKQSDGVHYLEADLLDEHQSLVHLFADQIDVVVHLAWTVEHGAFWTSPDNLNWTAATLRLARESASHGVRRFVGVGTCYEYLWPSESNCKEFNTPLIPSTLYGVAKDATQRILSAYFDTVNLDFAWCRLFFLYGPGEGQNRLIPSLSRSLVRGEEAQCSSGRAVRDFLDVRDAGDALALVARSNIAGPINIASGEAISIQEVARYLASAAKRPELLQLGALADRAGEPPRIVADVTRLRQKIGFVPNRTLKQGLTEAVDYWRRHHEDGNRQIQP